MINVEIPIKGKVEKVWFALVEETSEWWHDSLYTSPYTKKMEIQEYVGGKMYEDFGNREGLVWAEVIGVKAPFYIDFKGHLSPEFGGPNISFAKIELKEKEDYCIIHYKEEWLISGDIKFNNNLEKGWHDIFMYLKRYVENQ